VADAPLRFSPLTGIHGIVPQPSAAYGAASLRWALQRTSPDGDSWDCYVRKARDVDAPYAFQSPDGDSWDCYLFILGAMTLVPSMGVGFSPLTGIHGIVT